MNIIFSSTHMETLVNLQKLAEKHNCKISFACYSNTNKEEINSNILKENGASEEIIEKLLNDWQYNLSVNNIENTDEHIWFQLYDPEGKKQKNAGVNYIEVLYLKIKTF